jgi:hypothetical protein
MPFKIFHNKILRLKTTKRTKKHKKRRGKGKMVKQNTKEDKAKYFLFVVTF